jgi:hypothetical protein
MNIDTYYEGIAENGQIKLIDNIRLPEKTKVYIMIPARRGEKPIRIFSPHLAHAEQAADFEMKVTEAPDDDGL